MSQTEQAEQQIAPRKVFVAISAITGELAKIGIAKTQRNKDQGYNFRGIDEVYNTLAPLLAKYKLVILPKVQARAEREITFKSGGKGVSVVLQVEYQFVSAEDSSYVSVVTVGEGIDNSDKASNKALSAAYKYAVIQAFAIPVEGTPDADAETPERAATDPDGHGAAEPSTPLVAITLDAEALAKLRERIKATNSSEAKITKFFEIESLEKMTKQQAKDLGEWLTEKEKALANPGASAGNTRPAR